MGLKQLKTEHKFLNLTLADILTRFDPSKTKKYTQFLVKQVVERCNRIKREEYLSDGTKFDFIKDIFVTGGTEDVLTLDILSQTIGLDRIKTFHSFCELMEKGLVIEKDITKYDSWEMVSFAEYEALNRERINAAKKDIIKVYEDDTYLVLKPLTHLASIAYGYQTKWCTAMTNESEYFYRYSKNGILIYCINKKDNTRFAFYRRLDREFDENGETIFEVWNAEDKRVDSFQTRIPYEILRIVSMETDTSNQTNVPNYKHFGENELVIMSNKGFNVFEGEGQDEKITELPMMVDGMAPLVQPDYAHPQPIGVGFRVEPTRPLLIPIRGGRPIEIQEDELP